MKALILSLMVAITFFYPTAQAQPPSYVPSNGLIGYWPFNGNANDESVNENNGVVHGATMVSDRFGISNNAFSFDGVNDYIEVEHDSSLYFSDAYSVAFWINNNADTGGWYGCVNKDYWFSSTGLCTFIAENVFFYSIPIHAGWIISTPLSIQSWDFLCLTNQNGIAKLYKNGIEVGNDTIPITNNLSTLIFGARHDNVGTGQTNYLNGCMDDIGIWNRALTEQEIMDLYNGEQCTTPSPVGQGATLCGSGTATLTATGGTAYNWYDISSGGTVIATGSTFVTPFISQSTTYWVSNFDSCESSRVPVSVLIIDGSILQNDTVINAGQSITLNIQGASNQIPSNGLVGYWPFNGNANDESGNGNHGNVNGATLTIDRFGNINSAYSFDGLDDAIEVIDSPSLRCRKICVSMWALRNTPQAWQILYKGNLTTAQNEGYAINASILSSVKINSNCTPGQGWKNAFLNQSLNLNEWTHILFTFDGDTLKNFLNGVYVNSYNFNGLIDSCVGGNLRFGFSHLLNGNSGDPWDGKLDDIRIYSHALNQEEITALFNDNSGFSNYSYLWSTGDTTPSITVSPPVTTTYTVTVSNGSSYCVDSVTVTINNPNAVISGTLTYDNTANTPIGCSQIQLKTPSGQIVESTTTDPNGHYSFFDIPNGSYSINASTNIVWGGVNAIDALLALKHFTGIQILSGIRLKAADVNGNGYINASDALLIQKRFVGITNSFDAGDWIIQDSIIALTGSDSLAVNLKGLCVGDLNGSYIPQQSCYTYCPGIPSFVYGGQTYNTVKIGTQCWMRENLNIGTYVYSNNTGVQHSDVSNNSVIEKYCYNNDSSMCTVLGGLYDWDELMQYTTNAGTQGICPTGWHVPTADDWQVLTGYLGGDTMSGGKLKEAGLANWFAPNLGATNQSGFTAIGSGDRSVHGYFGGKKYAANFWSSSVIDPSHASAFILGNQSASIGQISEIKQRGFSLRCIRNCDSLPTTADAGADQIITTGATTTTLQGNTPTIGTGTWTISFGDGGVIAEPNNPSSSFSGQPNIDYWLKWTISNACGMSSDSVLIFFQPIMNVPCPGTPTLTYGGQTYNTVKIGTQCWMRENLNIGTMAISNNTGVSHSDVSNNGIIEKYCYQNNPAMCDIYGGLYDWDELMQYDTISGIQGICPAGWHVPTSTEWQILSDYLGGNTIAGGKLKETGFTHWLSPNAGATNQSGFTAIGSGDRSVHGYFGGEGYAADFWSSTNIDAVHAHSRILGKDSAEIGQETMLKTRGYSIRCIKD